MQTWWLFSHHLSIFSHLPGTDCSLHWNRSFKPDNLISTVTDSRVCQYRLHALLWYISFSHRVYIFIVGLFGFSSAKYFPYMMDHKFNIYSFYHTDNFMLYLEHIFNEYWACDIFTNCYLCISFLTVNYLKYTVNIRT